MGILGSIWNGLTWIGKSVFGIFNAIADAGETLRRGTDKLFGFKKPPSAKIRAALREQWLAIGPKEPQIIPGVEWEGELYFETPK